MSVGSDFDARLVEEAEGRFAELLGLLEDGSVADPTGEAWCGCFDCVLRVAEWFWLREGARMFRDGSVRSADV